MRYSLSHIKGVRFKPLSNRPNAEATIGKVYDYLMENKGLSVSRPGWIDGPRWYNCLDKLDVFYGLDIIRMRERGSDGKVKFLYLLAGEGYGPFYIDYLVDRINV